jgi:hypothetical protein
MKMKTEHQEQIRIAKVPGWFKCRLFEASEGRRPFGERALRAGYANAGEALAENLHQVLDREKIAEIRRWSTDLEQWTCVNVKRFYELIPASKRRVFIEGFRRGLLQRDLINPVVTIIREERPAPPKTWLKLVQAEETPVPPKYLEVETVTLARD